MASLHQTKKDLTDKQKQCASVLTSKSSMTRVELGFAEFCEPWEVESRMFPSKIGGKPAWLDLEKLPTAEDLQCLVCKQQTIFLCQIYAPFENDPDNFHRTVFIFICRSPACCKENTNLNLKVFRSTLAKENKFYSNEPPVEQPDPGFNLSKWVTLCELCGCYGDKKCSKCKSVVYCSREHQVIDWKERHKHGCNGIIVKDNSTKLFPEMNIIIDDEASFHKEVDEIKELEKFEQMKVAGNIGTMPDVPEEELEQYVCIDDDKVFKQFKKRIGKDDDQVLRYERGGEPLWIAKEPKPAKIPNCESCNSPRQFEFQIMPQLLSILKENVLDFGILAIYTCKKSCTEGGGYKKEYIFKQDICINNNNNNNNNNSNNNNKE